MRTTFFVWLVLTVFALLRRFMLIIYVQRNQSVLSSLRRPLCLGCCLRILIASGSIASALALTGSSSCIHCDSTALRSQISSSRLPLYVMVLWSFLHLRTPADDNSVEFLPRALVYWRIVVAAIFFWPSILLCLFVVISLNCISPYLSGIASTHADHGE